MWWMLNIVRTYLFYTPNNKGMMKVPNTLWVRGICLYETAFYSTIVQPNYTHITKLIRKNLL